MLTKKLANISDGFLKRFSFYATEKHKKEHLISEYMQNI